MEHADNEAMCSNPDCNELVASLATIALGSEITPDEQQRLLAALVLCAGCRQRLEHYATLAQALPLVVPEAEPPPDLRDRIVAAAQRTPPAQPAKPQPRRRLALPRWFVSRPVLAAALALMLLFSFGQQSQLMQQQEQLVQQQVQLDQQQVQLDQQQAQSSRNRELVLAAFGNDDAQDGQLEPTRNAPTASGQFFISPEEPALALYARHLPSPSSEQEYQVWIVSEDQPISAGTFTVNPEGRAWRLVKPAEQLTTIDRVFITLEPQGGSPQPTGPEYLTGRP